MSVENIANIGAEVKAGFQLFSTLTHVLGAELEHLNLSAHFDGAHDVGAENLSMHHEGGLKEIHALGSDPVIDHEKVDPVDHTEEPPTDVENDHRPIMESARAAAREAGWSEAKTNAFLKAIHENYDNLANGSAQDGNYNSPKIVQTTIDPKSGEVVFMGNGEGKGGYGAERVILSLNKPEAALNMTFTYEENGKTFTEDVRFADRCSNPILNTTKDVEVVQEVPPKEVCAADEWEIARPDTSKEGIDFDGHGPLPRVHEYETWVAPKGVTVDGAEAYIQSAFENDPRFSSIKEGETRHFILWLNDDCDGVPDHAQCVTVTRIDGQIVVSADSKLDTMPGEGERFFEDMTIEERKAWGGIK